SEESPAATLDVEVEVVADPEVAAGALRALVDAAGPVAADGRWTGREGHSPLDGLALAASPERAVFVPGDLLGEPGVRSALAALVGEGGPPVVAHRAKELMHGLAPVDLTGLDRDTAVMAYLLDPGEGRYD